VRALICEDEPLARRALLEYLADVDWIEVVGEASNGSEAVRAIQKLEPDIVFLDVRMPGLSGLEVLDTVSHHSAVVFTTAYDEYAVRAFDVGAVDYLLKPFGRERLLETLGRVRVRLIGEGMVTRSEPSAEDPRVHPRRLFARRRSRIVPVVVADILRIDASPGGVQLHCEDGSFEMECTLGELEARLDPGDFVRVHRSHMVNLGHLASIARYDERRLELTLSDGSSLVASRLGSKALRSFIG